MIVTPVKMCVYSFSILLEQDNVDTTLKSEFLFVILKSLTQFTS